MSRESIANWRRNRGLDIPLAPSEAEARSKASAEGTGGPVPPVDFGPGYRMRESGPDVVHTGTVDYRLVDLGEGIFRPLGPVSPPEKELSMENLEEAIQGWNETVLGHRAEVEVHHDPRAPVSGATRPETMEVKQRPSYRDGGPSYALAAFQRWLVAHYRHLCPGECYPDYAQALQIARNALKDASAFAAKNLELREELQELRSELERRREQQAEQEERNQILTADRQAREKLVGQMARRMRQLEQVVVGIEDGLHAGREPLDRLTRLVCARFPTTSAEDERPRHVLGDLQAWHSKALEYVVEALRRLDVPR